jgi:type II secretory pathway pseudopilin PulG
LVEVLITVCLIAAVATLVLGAAVRPTVSAARRAVQQENLYKLESALEVFHAQHARYPDALLELVAGPADASGEGAELALLSGLPDNPLGGWGYDGNGRVWPTDAAAAARAEGPTPPQRSVPYHVGSVIALALAFLGSLSPGLVAAPLSAAWRSVLAASLQGLAFRGGAWDHLARSAWLGLARDLIRSEGELKSLVLYSSSGPLARGAVIDNLTARLRRHMQRQADERRIPIRRSQWRSALANFDAILRSGPPRAVAAATRLASTPRAVAPGILLALGGGALSVIASRVASVPVYSSLPSLLLLTGSLLLAARLLSSLRAPHRQPSP